MWLTFFSLIKNWVIKLMILRFVVGWTTRVLHRPPQLGSHKEVTKADTKYRPRDDEVAPVERPVIHDSCSMSLYSPTPHHPSPPPARMRSVLPLYAQVRAKWSQVNCLEDLLWFPLYCSACVSNPPHPPCLSLTPHYNHTLTPISTLYVHPPLYIIKWLWIHPFKTLLPYKLLIKNKLPQLISY